MYQTDLSTFSEGLLRVRARFVDDLEAKRLRLVDLRSQIVGHVPSHEALLEIGQISHKIAGTASTLGFPELGKNAAAIDGTIDQKAAFFVGPSLALLDTIDQMIADIERVQAAAR